MISAPSTEPSASDRIFVGSPPANRPALRKSIVVRFGCYLTLLVSLALAGMFSALLFADYSHQDAAVINQAGSLRMLTYRLALDPSPINRQALQGTLRARLESEEIARLLRRADAEAPIRLQHEKLRQELKKLDLARGPALETLDTFVSHIDAFVSTLQSNAEQRSQMLSTVQGLCLFLSLLVVFISLYDLSYHVVGPLRDLTTTARRLGQGDLSARVSSSGEDELSQLGERFNQMATELQAIYRELEARVEDKTRDLSNSHQRLELLYASARRLGQDPYDERTLQPLLNQLERVLQAGKVTLCLNKDGVERAYTSLTTDGITGSFCLQGNCGDCRAQADHCGEPVTALNPLLMQPLSIGEHRFGELFIETASGRLEDWQRQFVEGFCDNIARTFALSLQQEQENRLALFAERSTIARELHDSLAQSLSYLKIQVSRLATLLKRDVPAEKIDETLDELREGLNSAYRQLRELLTTFRLSLEQSSLEAALVKTVEEFGERGDLTIDLDNRLAHIPLNPNEEIHILQIVREALSNVVRHARASHAKVSLAEDADDQVCITVDDDGVGFDPAQSRNGHYGLSIMRERSQTLEANFSIAPREPQGTRVSVRFTHKPLSQSPENTP
ncbi:histidine kinase [Pseudomonas sp. SCB32]|uniref:histidine kinase n=1 Tax=Pseudomonas sp. SCB32 TaxID=2653853 RepID=UPI00126504B8|nr:histidine kinase [Pseudomonas sp. SCB32]